MEVARYFWKHVCTEWTAVVVLQEFMASAGEAGVVLASTGTIVVLSAALASSLLTCTEQLD